MYKRQVIGCTAEVSVQAYVESSVPLVASHLLALCQMSAFHFSRRILVHAFHRRFDTAQTFSVIEKFQGLFNLGIVIVQHAKMCIRDRYNRAEGRP